MWEKLIQRLFRRLDAPATPRGGMVLAHTCPKTTGGSVPLKVYEQGGVYRCERCGEVYEVPVTVVDHSVIGRAVVPG